MTLYTPSKSACRRRPIARDEHAVARNGSFMSPPDIASPTLATSWVSEVIAVAALRFVEEVDRVRGDGADGDGGCRIGEQRGVGDAERATELRAGGFGGERQVDGDVEDRGRAEVQVDDVRDGEQRELGAGQAS